MDKNWATLVYALWTVDKIGLWTKSGQKSEYKSNRKESKMWTEIYKKWTKNGQMIDRC